MSDEKRLAAFRGGDLDGQEKLIPPADFWISPDGQDYVSAGIGHSVGVGQPTKWRYDYTE